MIFIIEHKFIVIEKFNCRADLTASDSKAFVDFMDKFAVMKHQAASLFILGFMRLAIVVWFADASIADSSSYFY